MDSPLLERGSRFGNATPMAAIIMSGMAGPISRAMTISRDTVPQRPIRAAGISSPRSDRCRIRVEHHIHFAISDRGFERFVTQMYVAGEPRIDSDPVVMGDRDAATPIYRSRL